MKRISFLFCFALITMVAAAQDIIITAQAERIEALITEISSTEIRYKKWNYQNGPTFVLSVNELNSIIYGNGDVQLFKPQAKESDEHEEEAKEDVSEGTDTPTTNVRHRYINDVRFQGYIFGGDNFGFSRKVRNRGSILYGPSLDFDFGVRIKDFFYVGFDFGTHFLLTPERLNMFYLGNGTTQDYYAPSSQRLNKYILYCPLAVSTKFYLPTKKQYLYPYLSLAVGGNLGIYGVFTEKRTYCDKSSWACGGAFIQFGAGIDIKRLSLGIGYTFISSKFLKKDAYSASSYYSSNVYLSSYEISNLAKSIDGLYLKIGVRLGRM